MRPRFFTHSSLVGVLFVMSLTAFPALGQDPALEVLVERSLAAMNSERWQESLDLGGEALSLHGKDDPLGKFGPRFGALFFRKGICEMKLGKWEEAMRSMEVCYRDFPNEGAAPGSENVFQKMALLKWGEAAMGAGNLELALAKFRKFLEERDRTRDIYPQGAFYINMAVCHYHAGRIPEGNENLEIAIRNRRVFPTPDSGIIAGFEMLANTAVAKKNEQALLDFMEKNRGHLMLGPALMQRYSGVFLKLAGDALAAGMERAALVLYQFVPSTEVALEEAVAELKSAGAPEDHALRADADRLRERLDGRNDPEAIRLAAVALLHEKNGNLRGAFAAYEQLELYFPKAENREENLYNLVRTASLVAAPETTRKHAEAFLKIFPGSPRAAELAGLIHP